MKNETSFTNNNSKFTEAKDVKINENLKTKTFCQLFFLLKFHLIALATSTAATWEFTFQSLNTKRKKMEAKEKYIHI